MFVLEQQDTGARDYKALKQHALRMTAFLAIVRITPWFLFQLRGQ
jgi:hypothetical protein